MSSILKAAGDLIDRLRRTIDNIEMRHQAAGYNFTSLRDEIAAVSSRLGAAEYGDKIIAAVQDHGAAIHTIKLGDLHIENVTQPRHPSAWAVRDGFGGRLSTSGEMDDEPLPSSRSYEWNAAHRWDHPWQALQAAADYLAKEGGAA